MPRPDMASVSLKQDTDNDRWQERTGRVGGITYARFASGYRMRLSKAPTRMSGIDSMPDTVRRGFPHEVRRYIEARGGAVFSGERRLTAP